MRVEVDGQVRHRTDCLDEQRRRPRLEQTGHVLNTGGGHEYRGVVYTDKRRHFHRQVQIKTQPKSPGY